MPSGPVSTRSETAGEGRQVKTASTVSASLRAESDQIAPAASKGFAVLGSMSCTLRSKPARLRLAASAPPRLPSPMKPYRIVVHASQTIVWENRLRAAAGKRLIVAGRPDRRPPAPLAPEPRLHYV